MTLRLCRRCYDLDAVREIHVCKGCGTPVCRHLIFLLRRSLCTACAAIREVQVDGRGPA